MILLSSFRVATCFKLVVASFYCCTSKVLDFFMHILKSKVFKFGVMFKDCGRKEVGYSKLFNGRGLLNVHYNNQVGVEQIQSSKVQTSKCFLFFVFQMFVCSSFLISCFQVPPCLSCDFEELQIQTHLPSHYK
jgi:hypothetical protein